MKTTLIALFCLPLIASVQALGGDQVSSSLQGKIAYQVEAQPNYADPEKVDLDLVIVNHSNLTMVVVLNGLDRIKLFGPDGKLIRPYPYRPSGMGSRIYAVECYPPGGRCVRELRLSGLFPFPTKGVYRCILTQRVYQWNSSEVPDTKVLFERDYYGTPIDLTAKEITFHVDKPTHPNRDIPKVDPQNGFAEPGFEYNPMDSKRYPLRGEGHYKLVQKESAKVNPPTTTTTTSPPAPSLGPPPAPRESPPPIPTSDEELSSSTPWAIIVVLIVAAGGLLWLLLKRRS